MNEQITERFLRSTFAALAITAATSAFATPLDGQVLGAGAPIANSTVTLWQAGSGAPRQLAQARTGADGRFGKEDQINRCRGVHR